MLLLAPAAAFLGVRTCTAAAALLPFTDPTLAFVPPLADSSRMWRNEEHARRARTRSRCAALVAQSSTWSACVDVSMSRARCGCTVQVAGCARVHDWKLETHKFTCATGLRVARSAEPQQLLMHKPIKIVCSS